MSNRKKLDHWSPKDPTEMNWYEARPVEQEYTDMKVQEALAVIMRNHRQAHPSFRYRLARALMSETRKEMEPVLAELQAKQGEGSGDE